MEFVHYSVMMEECLDGLKLKDGGIYFDGTLGGAGHSYEILKRTTPNGKLIATDLDIDAIQNAKKRLGEFDGRFTLCNTNFKNVVSVLEDCGVSEIDGAILDLGVSSYQLDNRERGFSYMSEDVRLDMRMDQAQKLTAYDVVNEYSKFMVLPVLLHTTIRDYFELMNDAHKIYHQASLEQYQNDKQFKKLLNILANKLKLLEKLYDNPL